MRKDPTHSFKTGYDSHTFQELRGLVRQAISCSASAAAQLPESLKKLETFIAEHSADYLLMLSDGHNTLLHEVLNFSKHRFNHLEDANWQCHVISEVYFIISAAILHRRPTHFLNLLCIQNGDGHAVLHRALRLGNVEIVRKILSTLESDNDLLKSNLKANSARHLSCLHLAIQSQNPELIKEMINYLSKDEHLLLGNLISQEGAGFTILQECVKNNPSVAVEQLLNTLLEPRNHSALEFNLTESIHHDYTILHDTIINQEFKILEKVCEILKSRKALLTKMLTTPNAFGMLPLHMAIQSGNVQKCLMVIALLQEDENALMYNMKHCTKKQHSMLSSTILSKSDVLVKTVLELLEQKPSMLEFNLKNVTHSKESIFFLVHERFNADMCQLILFHLSKFPEVYKEILQRRNAQGFSILQKVCFVKNEEMFFLFYSHLLRDNRLLTNNLTAISDNKWTSLFCAIKSNHVTILRKVVEALKQDPQEFSKQLATISKEGFSIIHGALMAEDPAITLEVLTILSEYPEILKKLLAVCTKDGYMALQSALFTNNEVKVSSVLSTLTSLSQFPHLLRANLENVTSRKFNVIQTALKTKNINIIRQVFAVLRNSSTLKQNVMHKNEYHKMALYNAFDLADAEIVKEVFSLIRHVPGALTENVLHGDEVHGKDGNLLVQALKTGNEKIVAMFFSEIEHDEKLMLTLLSSPGYKNNLPLLQALQSANLACLKILMGYLKKYPRAIERNIQSQNDFQYNCFHQAINSEDLEVVNAFIAFCSEHYGSQATQKLKELAKIPSRITFSAWSNPEFCKIIGKYYKLPNNLIKREVMVIGQKLPTVNDSHLRALVKKLSLLPDKQYLQLVHYTKEMKNEFKGNAIAFVTYSNSENQNNILHDVLDIARKKIHQDKLMMDLFSGLLLSLYNDLKFHHTSTMQDFLQSKNAAGETLLESAISLGDFKFIKMLGAPYLINKQARNIVLNTQRTSLLYRALQTANPEVLNFILIFISSQDILMENILYRDSGNNSCLHVAANSLNEQVIKKFVETVKSVYLKDNISILQKLAVPHDNFISDFWKNADINDLVYEFIRFNREPVSISTSTTAEPPLIEENYFARAARLRREARLNAEAEESASDVQIATQMPRQMTQAHRHMPMLYRIHGGIGQKYLGDILPTLPIPPKDPAQVSMEPQSYEHIHVFESLQRIAAEKESQIRPLNLETAYFKLSYYTAKRPVRSSEYFTFVISGRLMNASLPTPENGRCVLIFTAGEYNHVKAHLPRQVDVLVVHELKHCLGESYTDLTGTTKRRLAAFYLTHHLKINQFLMVDDNLKQVKFNSTQAVDNTWDAFFLEMCKEAREYGCVSVKTDSPKEITEGLLGSKLFCINMRKLRQFLPDTYDISLLSLPPQQSRKWGEDYYFQIMIHFLMNHTNQGYHIVSEKIACLERKKSLVNLAASRGIRARLFEEIDEIEQLFIEPEHIEKVHNTIAILNQIITENYTFYEKIRHHIENVDLLSLHAKANLLEWLPFIDFAEHPHFNDDFMARLTSQIEQQLTHAGARPYQAAAINSIKDMSTRQGRFKLTTGSGKTFQQSILAILGYHAAQPGQHIVIVVPHINLMTQFYRDCMKVNEGYIENNNSLAIPNNAVITVSSHQQSCNIGALLLNRPIKAQKAILIICEDSFANLLELDRHYLQRIPLLLLDEYQLYSSFVTSMLPIVQTVNPQTLTLGSTATPPAEDVLKPTLYRYHFLEGMASDNLSPVVTDSLGINYSKNNVNLLMKCLPAILNSQYHPGFQGQTRTLGQLKGIVYLPSIEDCQKTAKWLAAYNIRSHCIHSKNEQNKRDLQIFMESDEPGVLLAVYMLRIGFSHNQLAWAIIGQGANHLDKASRNKIKQMIGRVMRYLPNKYGYVLAFDDVVENIIKPYLVKQTFSIPFEQRYLQAKQTYKKREGVFQAVTVNTISTHRKDRISIIPSVCASSSLSPAPVVSVVSSSTSSNAILTSFHAARMAGSNCVRSKRVIHDPEDDAMMPTDQMDEQRQIHKRAAQESENTRQTRSRRNEMI